jgi:hypothetical protein
LLRQRIAQPSINALRCFVLEARQERGVDAERNADVGVPCPFAHQLDVNPIHKLVRDVGMAQAVERDSRRPKPRDQFAKDAGYVVDADRFANRRG